MEGLEDVIDDAVELGLTVQEMVKSPSAQEFATMIRRLIDARVNPAGWMLARMERCDGEQLVEVWCAEYGGPLDDGRRERIEIETRGNVYWTAKAPHLGVFTRVLREAIERLEKVPAAPRAPSTFVSPAA